MKTPHYLNKSLKSLRGEIWKDIPGYKGSYQASSLGRIRSLDRTIPHPRWGSQFVAGRILTQSIARNSNMKTGIPMIDLRVSLSQDGVMYYYNTRRLIYMTFVDSSIDYATDGLYIINKDGDGYNNKLSNLKLVTKEEKQRRVYQRGRIGESYLKHADRSKWKKQPGASRRKPVAQYDLTGNLIAKYGSVTQASEATNLDSKAIIAVAKGKYKQWNGFVWKYE